MPHILAFCKEEEMDLGTDTKAAMGRKARARKVLRNVWVWYLINYGKFQRDRG